jgi:DMSO reductase anchor subunit
MLLAQVLPLAMFLLGAEWVIGSFAVLALTDLQGEVRGGFLGRYALTFFASALFVAWLRDQYPAAATLQSLGVQLRWADWEVRAFAAFVVLVGLYNPANWSGLKALRRALGLLASVAGVVTLIFSALAYGQAPLAGFGTILNFLVASLVLGAATTGLAVGHGYLSAPYLTPRPLRNITILLFGALALQLLSLPIYLGLVGFPAAAQKGGDLLATYGMIVGVRVAIGLLFPLVLAALAWYTTRMKAMRSATGLLYIGSGVVLTGEIVAKVLFFIGGLPL